MRKYTIAHSFLMIASVLAFEPFHVNRRQSNIANPTALATSAEPTLAQSSASASATVLTSNPVTSSSSSSSSSSSPSSAPSVTSTTSASTSASSIPKTTSASSSTPSSTLVSSTSSSPTFSTSILETTSASTGTNAEGSLVTVIVTSPLSATSSPSPSPAGAPQDNSSHTGTIIGASVAGGIAVVAVIAFIIWKVTRKRFSDLDDPDEAIKWPELNQTHTDVGGLSPQTSNTYPANISRNVSTFDHTDPYAVPPLPQFNPNQPYRDDPYASPNTGYYDPYRGPVPHSLDGHENIPLNTYPSGSRSKSPGPGRGSPAPEHASPVIGAVYDMGGRGSPASGPNMGPTPAAASLDKRPPYDV